MKPPCYKPNYSAYHGALLDIASIARNMQALCKKSASVPPTTLPAKLVKVDIPNLYLPAPDAITPLLIKNGCPAAHATSLSKVFLQSVDRTRIMCEKNYRTACEGLLRHPGDNPAFLSSLLAQFSSLVTIQYQNQVSMSREMAFAEFYKHQGTLPKEKTPIKPKTAFNQEFVPLLEKYFEYNAYPSAPDRLALARKSMMTSRQIEVWFQNHRNRAKKEGRPLRKLKPDSMPHNFSLDCLATTMPSLFIPEVERPKPLPQKASSPSPWSKSPGKFQSTNAAQAEPKSPFRESNQTRFSFDNTPPEHAFPTAYRRPQNHDPFSGPLNFAFPQPTWMRSPCLSSSLRRHVEPDIDSLIVSFSYKLSIRDLCSLNPSEDHSAQANPNGPWNAPKYVVVCAAPLPSLICSPVGEPRSSCAASCLAVPLSIDNDRFGTTSPLRRRRRKQKAYPHPKRLPKHRQALPSSKDTVSLYSATPYPPPASLSTGSKSRSSPFSSDCPDSRRSSSGSSSSSLPGTPTFSLVTLPSLDILCMPKKAKAPAVDDYGITLSMDDIDCLADLGC